MGELSLILVLLVCVTLSSVLLPRLADDLGAPRTLEGGLPGSEQKHSPAPLLPPGT